MRQDNIEKLIATGYKLIALETDSPDKTLNDFRPLVREGKAIYTWEKNSGLSRMEASHIKLPNTQTPEMVLKHIKQSKLFGIFLLIGFNHELASPFLLETLKSIGTDEKQNKIIIFIDHHFKYPQQLMHKLLITSETT